MSPWSLLLRRSKDLPFALNRFCGEKGIENAITVSDFKYRDFENVVGGYIPEVGLLARQVIVVDKEGTIKHLELIKETSSEPNYNAALEIVKEIIEIYNGTLEGVPGWFSLKSMWLLISELWIWAPYWM